MRSNKRRNKKADKPIHALFIKLSMEEGEVDIDELNTPTYSPNTSARVATLLNEAVGEYAGENAKEQQPPPPSDSAGAYSPLTPSPPPASNEQNEPPASNPLTANNVPSKSTQFNDNENHKFPANPEVPGASHFSDVEKSNENFVSNNYDESFPPLGNSHINMSSKNYKVKKLSKSASKIVDAKQKSSDCIIDSSASGGVSTFPPAQQIFALVGDTSVATIPAISADDSIPPATSLAVNNSASAVVAITPNISATPAVGSATTDSVYFSAGDAASLTAPMSTALVNHVAANITSGSKMKRRFSSSSSPDASAAKRRIYDEMKDAMMSAVTDFAKEMTAKMTAEIGAHISSTLSTALPAINPLPASTTTSNAEETAAAKPCNSSALPVLPPNPQPQTDSAVVSNPHTHNSSTSAQAANPPPAISSAADALTPAEPFANNSFGPQPVRYPLNNFSATRSYNSRFTPRSPSRSRTRLAPHQYSAFDSRNLRANPCRFCRGEHRNMECPEFTTPNARRTAIQARNGCVNCLLPGHTVDACRGNLGTCDLCEDKHHFLLCINAARRRRQQ